MDCCDFVGGNFRADTRQVVVIDTVLWDVLWESICSICVVFWLL